MLNTIPFLTIQSKIFSFVDCFSYFEIRIIKMGIFRIYD